MKSAPQNSKAVAALCPQCALCCNGVIFGDVRLQAGDKADRLLELGVPLRQRGAVTRFAQPCSCLEGALCTIYPDRPRRCRTFECRLLQRHEQGEVTARTALQAIARARRHADKIRRLLRQLGNTDEAKPLARRYAQVMRQPVDLAAGPRQGDLQGALMRAVAELAEVLERDFL
jgi:Fe-S-cluster containining protein